MSVVAETPPGEDSGATPEAPERRPAEEGQERAGRGYRAPVASRSFPAIPKSVHEARHFAQQQLPAGPDPDVALVVSELATNAVLHAGTSFTVTVEATPGVVHIEVADQSESLPNHRDRRDDTTTGRGLFLVSAVAARWGFHAQSAGKVIWADVAIDDGTTRATAGPAASEAASG